MTLEPAALIGRLMSANAFEPAVLQLAIEDHEIISQFIANISRMFGGKPAADAAGALQAMTLLVNKKMLNHFAYEEKHVFGPLLAARSSAKTSRLVGELQQEHQALLQQVRQLNETLAGAVRDGGVATTWQALMAFLTNLEEHASKEDELFHLLLEKPS